MLFIWMSQAMSSQALTNSTSEIRSASKTRHSPLEGTWEVVQSVWEVNGQGKFYPKDTLWTKYYRFGTDLSQLIIISFRNDSFGSVRLTELDSFKFRNRRGRPDHFRPVELTCWGIETGEDWTTTWQIIYKSDSSIILESETMTGDSVTGLLVQTLQKVNVKSEPEAAFDPTFIGTWNSLTFRSPYIKYEFHFRYDTRDTLRVIIDTEFVQILYHYHFETGFRQEGLNHKYRYVVEDFQGHKIIRSSEGNSMVIHISPIEPGVVWMSFDATNWESVSYKMRRDTE